MSKKDIIVLVLTAVVLIYSLYRRYMKNKEKKGTVGTGSVPPKSGLAGQPDDYEPYSGNKK